MRSAHSIDELTKRNVAVIAQMERASQGVRTRGERLADAIATAVGSWPFIAVQTTVLVGWMVLNVLAWVRHWDPYPFILLNLALSFQAAYAAPILMISQNRQAKLNERRNHLDLQINMLAEQESTEILHLLRLLCERSGIRLREVGEAGLEEATRHDRIVEQIEAEIETPPIGQTAEEVTDDAEAEDVERVDAGAAELIAEKAAERIADKIVQKIAETADAKPAARPAAKAAAKAPERANGKAVEKGGGSRGGRTRR